MLPADDHACVALTIDGTKIFMQPYRRYLPLLLLPMATMPLALYWLHKRRSYAYLTFDFVAVLHAGELPDVAQQRQSLAHLAVV